MKPVRPSVKEGHLGFSTTGEGQHHSVAGLPPHRPKPSRNRLTLAHKRPTIPFLMTPVWRRRSEPPLAALPICYADMDIAMKHIFRLSRLALVVTCFYTQIGLADEIKLRADNWCPYNCDPSSGNPGFMVDIARAILEPAGHKVNYQIMPWSRALTEVRKGSIQGVIGAQQSEAPDLIYGSTPVALDDSGFAVRKGEKFRYGGPASLDMYRIGGILDYNYDGGEIDAYIKQNSSDKDRIQLNTGDAVGNANLRKLMARRVDIVMDSTVVLTYLVRQLGLESKIDIIPLGHPTEIYIAFSPADPRSKMWAAQLSSGIEALKIRGQMAGILARYGLTDSQKP